MILEPHCARYCTRLIQAIWVNSKHHWNYFVIHIHIRENFVLQKFIQIKH